jgi:rRNA small subunit pseudouridine methyltransferase Nep1
MIVVNPEVRLPRNYERFIGLMEQLFLRGQVPPKGDPLLSFSPYDLEEVMSRLQGKSFESVSILALEEGDKKTMKELRGHFPEDSQVPAIVGIGAFPHGSFSKEVEALFDEKIALSSDVMMAWHVCAEVLWAYTWHRNLASHQD